MASAPGGAECGGAGVEHTELTNLAIHFLQEIQGLNNVANADISQVLVQYDGRQDPAYEIIQFYRL